MPKPTASFHYYRLRSILFPLSAHSSLKSDLEVPVSPSVFSTKLDFSPYLHFPFRPWPLNTSLYILYYKRIGVLIFPFARLTLSLEDKAHKGEAVWLCQMDGKN